MTNQNNLEDLYGASLTMFKSRLNSMAKIVNPKIENVSIGDIRLSSPNVLSVDLEVGAKPVSIECQCDGAYEILIDLMPIDADEMKHMKRSRSLRKDAIFWEQIEAKARLVDINFWELGSNEQELKSLLKDSWPEFVSISGLGAKTAAMRYLSATEDGLGNIKKALEADLGNSQK